MLSTRKRRRDKVRRIDVPCPHYPRCDGCPWVDQPYPQQLLRKRERVIEAFRRYAQLADIAVPPVVPSPRLFGYRGRVKLVLRKTRDAVMAGLYVPGSHRVVDIASCPLHPKPVNSVVQYLKRKFADDSIPIYDERNDTGALRYLDLRYSFTQEQLLVTLITRHRELAGAAALARSVSSRFPFVAGVIQNVNETRGNIIWGSEFRILIGRDRLIENLAGVKLTYPAETFSQANPFTAARVYETVKRLAVLTGRENVLDLYCGVGPIALMLAKRARFVFGADDLAAAIAAATENARSNGLVNAEFLAMDAAAAVTAAIRKRYLDLITMNPPRKGIQPPAMAAIVGANAPRLIYVSCDPLTLARDLRQLTEAGYHIAEVQPFDMFPHTQEVETLVLLTKN
ncbi:MAG TPA: 23S rRNA (uracil(1939)-C(5))-methyltransferase RlmD [Candidatus Binatia bacterium]